METSLKVKWDAVLRVLEASGSGVAFDQIIRVQHKLACVSWQVSVSKLCIGDIFVNVSR